jgi:hypothetical protein
MTSRKWLVVVLLAALYTVLLRWLIDPRRQRIEIDSTTFVGIIALLGSLPMLVLLVDCLATLRPSRPDDRDRR